MLKKRKVYVLIRYVQAATLSGYSQAFTLWFAILNALSRLRSGLSENGESWVLHAKEAEDSLRCILNNLFCITETLFLSSFGTTVGDL